MRRRLFELLDGVLDAAEGAAVQRHLDECRDCRNAVSHDRRFLRAVRQHGGRDRAPEPLRARLRAALLERTAADARADAARGRRGRGE